MAFKMLAVGFYSTEAKAHTDSNNQICVGLNLYSSGFLGGSLTPAPDTLSSISQCTPGAAAVATAGTAPLVTVTIIPPAITVAIVGGAVGAVTITVPAFLSPRFPAKSHSGQTSAMASTVIFPGQPGNYINDQVENAKNRHNDHPFLPLSFLQ